VTASNVALIPDNPRTMKVLFFHPLTGHLWRGIERNVVSLANGMAHLGHLPTVLTLRHPERALLDELDPRVVLVQVPASRYYAYTVAVPYFAAHLARNQYDAIIAFFGGFGVGPSLRLAGLVRHTPCYLYLGYPVEVAPHRYREIERWGLQESSAGIWAHGEHVARAAAQRFRRPVSALPTGVDVDRFRQDPTARARARDILNLSTDGRVILTVAALDERKGIQHVLEALFAIREAVPEVKYVVAGEGMYRRELEALVARLGLQDNVTLLGAYDRVELLYSAVDVFCLPARGEAGPIVIYEALAASLPVVTLRSEHLELHLSGDVVEMIPDTAPATIANAVTVLLADELRREQMGRVGQALVEQHYSYARLAGTLLEIMAGHEPLSSQVRPVEM